MFAIQWPLVTCYCSLGTYTIYVYTLYVKRERQKSLINFPSLGELCGCFSSSGQPLGGTVSWSREAKTSFYINGFLLNTINNSLQSPREIWLSMWLLRVIGISSLRGKHNFYFSQSLRVHAVFTSVYYCSWGICLF